MFNIVIYEILLGSNLFNNDNIPNETIDSSPLDSDKFKTFGEKAKKSPSILAKIYDNVFNPNNKHICIIKPFPIIKEGYLKVTPLNTETDNSQTSLSEYISNKVSENKNKQIALNISSETDQEISLSTSSLSSSSSGYDTLIIDLKVLEGIDGKNKRSIILKDINDPSSENLISILNKPENIKLSYDKVHIQDKNCPNHKYLSFNTQNYNSEKYKVEMHEKYDIYGPGYNSSHYLSLSIKNEAVNRINNNSLIVESDNCNVLPFKQIHSFASSSQILPSEF